ncbi:hypothetical protein [Marivita sp.]|jgi:uncharacterized protein YjiS (DUF1127 family)|uniref:hypothetical protein n=1 Tax=Marivita sp. TaxID=2003365 RepID=UPI0023B4FCB0
MAHTLDHVPSTTLLSRILNAIVRMGENSSRAQTVKKLNAISDEQLLSMGITRAQLVQRALSSGEL